MGWLRRKRQQKCSADHDAGRRIHAWKLLDITGTIECQRCGIRREGHPDPGYFVAIQKIIDRGRAEGLL